jgi:hypothetical protein
MWADRVLSSKEFPIMKKGFVVAVFLGVAFAAASPRHNDPAASAPAHSTSAPSPQASKGDPATSGGTDSSAQVATDQAVTVTDGLPVPAAPAFGWLIVLACTVALVVAIATVVLTAAALRG